LQLSKFVAALAVLFSFSPSGQAQTIQGGSSPHFSNCASIGGRLVMSVG